MVGRPPRCGRSTKSAVFSWRIRDVPAENEIHQIGAIFGVRTRFHFCRYPFKQSKLETPVTEDRRVYHRAWDSSPLQGGHLFPDRRQYPRLVPDSPLLVYADEYTGLLSDLCEGGLAVHSRFPNIQGQLFFLTVGLPGSNSTMRVTAQTTWTSDAENKTGLRFVNLPAASRQQLREWVSAWSTTTVKEVPPAYITSQSDAQFNLAEVRRQLSAGVEPAELEAPRRNEALLRFTGLVLAAATLCSVFIFLDYYLGSGRRHPQTRTLVPVAETVGLHARGQEEPEKLPPETNQPPITVPLDTPGLVLQVGAMTHESNANGLSESLQRNNFPAFVFKRSSDRFYKVAVGAFADADSAAVVKRELEKQGFKPILRQWSPE